MAATASGPPTVFPTVLYADARAAVRTLTEAFGFAPAAVHESEDGQIAHAELSLGNGAVMIGPKGTGSAYDRAMAEGGPVGVYVVVADVDAHHARAAAHEGVEILVPPTDQEYGSRDYMARDAEGNIWSFGTYGPELPA
ncbi:VOC family protein [Streptomyces albidoflavus]|uniref:VOC family protein n=1 Tax=Streptomyces albidoflavus TaxID=1886 RepID=UPI001C448FAA|nr:VOC family protein [Streptomyces albidoflavus]MBV7647745.1 glyoxalase [Streptomyces albidoflavus]MBV7709202.1 glyoxalase [Streptomyces albidoflavus]